MIVIPPVYCAAEAAVEFANTTTTAIIASISPAEETAEGNKKIKGAARRR